MCEANTTKKVCRICNVELIVDKTWREHRVNRNDKICINCNRIEKREYDKQYKIKNKLKIKEKNKIYSEKTRAEKREYDRLYRLNNKEKSKQYQKQYYENNKEKIKSKDKRYYQLNKEIIDQKHKIYRENNKDKFKIYHKKTYQKEKERKKLDTNFKITKLLRSRINKAVKRNQKSGSAVRDLGCSISEFKTYLESKFQEGMSWNNWSTEGWHLDHIIPLSSFDLTDREQFLKACHYTNLQPLWAKENITKGAKLHKQIIEDNQNATT